MAVFIAACTKRIKLSGPFPCTGLKISRQKGKHSSG